MTLLRRVTEICRERLPSIRVARITIDSIYDLDKMLQPGIRFGVTVRNTSELIGTPIAYIEYFYFSVDVMDGDERMIIQRMETWRNGTYKAFYRIFYDEVCQTRLDGVYGEELGWRDAYKAITVGQPDVYNLSVNVPAEDGYYTMDKDYEHTPFAPEYVPVANRKVGLLITFMSVTGWQTWQYKGIEAVIGEVLEDDWLNPSYWKQKDAESVLTKAAIEEKLTGDIETHTHEHLNQLCELVAVRTAHPDITIEVYEQGAKYYNSLTNLIHTLDYSNEANPWFYAEQPKVGVLYYSLSDESSSYAKLWRYTGTEMLEIPVHPYLASDSAQHDIINLTEMVPPTDDFYTLSVQSLASQYAPTYVPVGVRKEGLIITFRSYSEWETWQFVGALAGFAASGNWKRIDAFIEQGVYDMDQQSPLLSGQYYQCSNDDDDYYIPSSIPEESRVAFMKVRYINSYGQRVILRYASSNFAYFHDYDYWDVLKVSDLSSTDIEKMLTGLITTHYHDTVQTDRVTPVEAVNAPIARSFSLDPHSAGQGYLIITDAYTFSETITIELTMSYLIQDSFYRYVLYIDMRHSGPLQLAITKDGDDIILKGDSTLNMSLEKGIYKIEFIRQMSSGTDLVLYARHDFIPDDVL